MSGLGQTQSFPAVGAKVCFSQDRTLIGPREDDRVSPLAAIPTCSLFTERRDSLPFARLPLEG